MAIRISTGRRHQIRAHLAHAGHPVVCDAKYGQSSQVDKARGTVEQYHQDLQWCSRNFLHRYRVAWDSQEPHESYEALAVLPSELKEALTHLSPKLHAGRVCPTSAKQLQWWLEGKVLTDSADWDQFPQLIHSASILVKRSGSDVETCCCEELRGRKMWTAHARVLACHLTKDTKNI